MSRANFADLVGDARWTPIRGCPGRFVFRGPTTTTIDDLVGSVRTTRCVSMRARDSVDVVAFASGGGLICYVKPDGHVHTLCDAAGFARKLADLGIEPPSPM